MSGFGEHRKKIEIEKKEMKKATVSDIQLVNLKSLACTHEITYNSVSHFSCSYNCIHFYFDTIYPHEMTVSIA